MGEPIGPAIRVSKISNSYFCGLIFDFAQKNFLSVTELDKHAQSDSNLWEFFFHLEHFMDEPIDPAKQSGSTKCLTTSFMNFDFAQNFHYNKDFN